ncbi:MAG TPA: HXXEE domain-containing protein [Anaerolineales bacterium]|nr:HXXEE domain-containing protein [Anaerolineales bacterium]
MPFDTTTLIWLFPIAFILHDFEEIIFFEPWLKKNATTIMGRLHNRVPAFFEKQLQAIVTKSTPQFALPISLIFTLTSLASFLAAQYAQYSIFLAAVSLFFLHGFMHLGQAIFMRRYIPAVITSLLIVIPYGFLVLGRFLSDGLVDYPALLIYALIGLLAMIPFILVMHRLGEGIYHRLLNFLVR